jgi:hypothetical protein
MLNCFKSRASAKTYASSELMQQHSSIEGTVGYFQAESKKKKPAPTKPTDRVRMIQERVDLCLSLREKQNVQDVFGRFSLANSKVIPKERLGEAMALVTATEKTIEEIDGIFESMDLNSDGGLDFEEFERACEEPCELQRWLGQIRFDRIIFDGICALPSMSSRSLKSVSELGPAEIRDVCAGLMNGLEFTISKECASLKCAFDMMMVKNGDLVPNDKFGVASEMESGTIEDFHKGVEQRLGTRIEKLF